MVARWGDRVGHLHWGWDLWWRRGGWRAACPPCSPQHLIWEDALNALPRTPDLVFALVRNPVERLVSEYRYQRHQRRGTRLGRILACLPFSLWLRVMLMVAVRNPYAFDNHLRPQSDFVPHEAQVFALEAGLEPVLDWLGIDTGGQQDTPHRLKSRQAKLSVADVDRALIEERFAADYARFGYAVSGAAKPARPGIDRLAAAFAPTVAWLERRGRL